MSIKIRNEETKDFKTVEEITRKSFYNLYIQGCTEHYIVHILRKHKDFIKELAFVIELDGEIIGNIMYTKATLHQDNGQIKEIVSFGPVCVLAEYQRKGYGKILLEHSFEKAKELGYDVVVVIGSPSNYVGRGFKSCKRFNISVENGVFPTGMMAIELNEGTLDGKKWTYYGSDVMNIDEKEAARFDDNLETMEKKYQSSQEEFYILSNSTLM